MRIVGSGNRNGDGYVERRLRFLFQGAKKEMSFSFFSWCTFASSGAADAVLLLSSWGKSPSSRFG